MQFSEHETLAEAPIPAHVTVSGRGMKDQPVTSMTHLRTLDSLYGKKHAWGLVHSRAAATLSHFDAIGLTLMQNGQPIGAYGALQAWKAGRRASPAR